MYEERLKTTNFTDNVAYGSAFDTTWTLAQALNYTEEMRLHNETEITNCENITGELVPLDKFNYSNAYMGCVIKYNMHRVNFKGFSVSCSKLCVFCNWNIANTYHSCISQGLVRYGDDGTIVYTKIRLAQMRSSP